MLKAINLTKKFQSFIALDSLHLQVQKGDIYCLLGANGAGKTTTINLFLGFTPPSYGEVLIDGLSVVKHPLETKKLLTYIPENLMLYPNLSGIENLEYFSILSGKKHSRQQLIDFLAGAGLQTDAFGKRVAAYSKGMRQKIGIALALAKSSSVLLLDEPTSGLDPQASNEFSNLLLKMKDANVATLMATHDIFRAHSVGTHVGIMREGRLVHELRTKETTIQDLERLYLKTMEPAEV